jgi:hypothetical protein
VFKNNFYGRFTKEELCFLPSVALLETEEYLAYHTVNMTFFISRKLVIYRANPTLEILFWTGYISLDGKQETHTEFWWRKLLESKNFEDKEGCGILGYRI